jgi:SAM-dependent methyltransferase
MTDLPSHLGGHSYKTNVDIGALTWIKETFRPKSFLDIGCGPGGMVDLALEEGLDAYGIDGDFTLKRNNPQNILIHDFTKGPAPLKQKYDIGWSVEFVEHVYEKYIPNYIQSFQACNVMIMTFAPPGHGGYHHVNENTQEYWIETLGNYGFKYHYKYTEDLRNVSTMNKRKHTANFNKLRKAFVHLRGLVFTK